ncbi:MAG TPA: AAA family ATPase, partial [Solirubrobacteraceae bacterium]|nr:AAA family ATPase [Solirubrobacteraceae bacterium]
MLRSAIAPLLEREDELSRLVERIAAAREGRGTMVLVEGPPGIGKTRLLDAARERARAEDMLVLSARASELDREFPFGVVRQLFEPLVAEAPRDSPMLRGAAGRAASLLGAGAPEGAAAPLAHFHALYWLTANLAEQGPVA